MITGVTLVTGCPYPAVHAHSFLELVSKLLHCSMKYRPRLPRTHKQGPPSRDELPRNLAFEQWADRLRMECRQQDGIQWRLGDLLLYGKGHYGQRCDAVISEMGISRQT